MTCRLFELVREVDVTGISGTGKIAMGVQWPDRQCTLYWLRHGTTGNYQSISQLEEIHCYNSNAHIEWLNNEEETYTVTLAPKSGLD